MIERKPALRLGINGPDEVKNHPWIKNFPWKQLYLKEINPPYKPVNIYIILVFFVLFIKLD